MNKPRVVSVGLGPIGLSAARLTLEKQSLELVGAVDPAADKVGKDLGVLLGKGETGLIIGADAEEAYRSLKPDAIIHCTSSFFPRIVDQLLAAARHGVNVVSSSEELLVPDYRHPDLAQKVHAAALEGGATILGTGVNPGFAMDFMATTASATCFDVTSVRCRRVVDAGTRRLPLQRKVGAGLTPEEFAQREAAGGFGHIGMEESVVLVARALGWELDTVEQSLEPVIAKESYQTQYMLVEAEQVAGIRNIGRGWVGSHKVIELDLTMAVGAENPRDELSLTGTPPSTWSLKVVSPVIRLRPPSS